MHSVRIGAAPLASVSHDFYPRAKLQPRSFFCPAAAVVHFYSALRRLLWFRSSFVSLFSWVADALIHFDNLDLDRFKMARSGFNLFLKREPLKWNILIQLYVHLFISKWAILGERNAFRSIQGVRQIEPCRANRFVFMTQWKIRKTNLPIIILVHFLCCI